MSEKLTKRQFDILAAMAESECPLSQRQLEKITGYSLGLVNRVIKELAEIGAVSDGHINKKGFEILEGYRAKRAIFMAAGFGSRLVPITLNTPKPLVRVNGKRIIDGLIDAVLGAGIEEIIIVRGYLREEFDLLLSKYPMIKFVDNPIFNEANNISSIYQVKDKLENAYVLESDFLISNPSIIKKYHYCSDFLGIYRDRSDDWCFKAPDGYITEQAVGAYDCYEQVGISYWDAQDGKKLLDHIEKAFDMPGGKELYWEQVPLKVFKDEYKVAIKECQLEDIVEIDTFSELKALDKSYDL